MKTYTCLNELSKKWMQNRVLESRSLGSLRVLGVPESWESWESRESRSLKPRIVPLPDPLPATQTKPRVGVRPSNAQLTCLILSPGQNMWLQMLLRIIAWGTTRLYSYKGRVKAMSQTLYQDQMRGLDKILSMHFLPSRFVMFYMYVYIEFLVHSEFLMASFARKLSMN